MLEKVKKGLPIKKRILDERRKLLQAVHLAAKQWQYGHTQEESNYVLMDILERRYMYLYRIAKKRNLNALE